MIQLKPLGLQSLHQQRSITAAEPKRRRIKVLGSENQTDKTFDHSPAHRLTRIPGERQAIAGILPLVVRICQRLSACCHGLQLQPQSGRKPAAIEGTVCSHAREAEHGAGINNHQWASLC
tara:strand:- start:197 stop:556 length:360 start_codon:yes stop_codon:yes gene_type:complete